jgi:nucleoside 2-deoxyribosyltransferase
MIISISPDTTDPSAPVVTCGLVMPISSMDGCSADHWTEVKSIIQESIESIENPRFSARLVSEADDVGVIQKRIVQGIYSSDIVVCDVSAKNANVMFELGMRLAFDKPTVIIKDDKTDYAFDTSIIEHLTYPRDLRFSRIVSFRKQLADKVLATHLAAQKDPTHSTFLKNFGTFSVAQLNQKEATGEQVILEALTDLQREMARLRRMQPGRIRVAERDRSALPALVSAVIELKTKDKNLSLDAHEELLSQLLEYKKRDVLAPYSSKEVFMEALSEACEIVRYID